MKISSFLNESVTQEAWMKKFGQNMPENIAEKFKEWAAKYNGVEAAKMLIDAGANVNCGSWEGVEGRRQKRGSLLDIANSKEIKDLLVKAGCAVEEWKSISEEIVKQEMNLDAIRFEKHTRIDWPMMDYQLDMFYKGRHIGGLSSTWHESGSGMSQKYWIDPEFRNSGFGKLLLLYGIYNDHQVFKVHLINKEGIPDDMVNVYNSLKINKAIIWVPSMGYRINLRNPEVKDLIIRFKEQTTYEG